jgi:hypothetical protein
VFKKNTANCIRFVCSQIGYHFFKTNEAKMPEIMGKNTKRIVSES